MKKDSEKGFKDQDGNTPLFLVCKKGYRGYLDDLNEAHVKTNRLEIVKLICNELDPDLLFTTKVEKMTPLHWAAYHGDYLVTEQILKAFDSETRSRDYQVYDKEAKFNK